MSDIDFPIVVIPDDGAESKEEDKDGNGTRCPRSEILGQIPLNQFDTRKARSLIITGKQYDKCGSGADKQGIYINTESLDKALYDRMACIGRSCGIRYGTFTGFVGEKSAFEARKNGRTHAAAENGIEVESITENNSECPGQLCKVINHNPQCNNDIDACHNRYNPFRDAGYTTETAANNNHGKNGHYATHHHPVDTECIIQCQ